MRKLGALLISCLLFIVLFQGCGNSNTSIETTDLGNIEIDNISIGTSSAEVNFDIYTESDRYSGDYKYIYDEIVMGENESTNKINYIFSRFDEDKTTISINNNSQLKTIQDISNILGKNYNEKWEDREQGLKSHVYYDNMRNIKAEFIYVSYDNSLSWIRISKLNKN